MNKYLNIEQYPLPKKEDIYAKIGGSKYFTKLDMTQAYQQFMLDESSRDILTINTPIGLLRPTRMPFGVASASAICQRVIDNIVKDIPFAGGFQDDVIIGGGSDSEHIELVRRVMKRF